MATNIPDDLKKDEINIDNIDDFEAYANTPAGKEKLREFNNKATDKLNVLLLGATGCGKSSLINRIFGLIGPKKAEVSDNISQTQEFKLLTDEKKPNLRIWDSRGYEIGQNNRFDSDLDTFLKETVNTDEFPHVVFYCLDIARRRIEEMDSDAIKKLQNNYQFPVVVLLTKLDRDKKGAPIKKSYIDKLTKEGIKPDIIFATTEKKEKEYEEFDELAKAIQYTVERLKELEQQKQKAQEATSSYQHEHKEDEKVDDIFKKYKKEEEEKERGKRETRERERQEGEKERQEGEREREKREKRKRERGERDREERKKERERINAATEFVLNVNSDLVTHKQWEEAIKDKLMQFGRYAGLAISKVSKWALKGIRKLLTK